MLPCPCGICWNLVEALKKTNKFVILENYDPLDVSYMKKLPQYAGKSDGELLILVLSSICFLFTFHYLSKYG